ncbi:MAG: isoleucine--tRNA ligase, partial [Proteobacteria bacterium]|nr:isoleucine--tRNA ligase [Pseudomonadota bacterium]MBU1711006.1 isoleucine--tRNA ligase [Pseudomonadota bacterium]
YRATLNLPQTNFKMKANLAQKEPEFLKKWDQENLYGRVMAATASRPVYMLHDGPPYANGHIHLGTAFNKVLKDIILKSKRMAGFHCPYVPGWDCHGLPIEHNVDKELGPKKKEISKLAFRGACRKYAEKWIKIQKAEFKRLGVLGDWDNPYLTINFGYEAAIAREFTRFLHSGAVIQSKKPVYWCASCKTALAEAEVEYYDHSSPSIYVKFPVADDLGRDIPALSGRKVSAVIWTTTPWTIPANLAVAFHPDFPYAAVEVGDEVWILAEGLVAQAFDNFGITDYKILTTFSAAVLEGKKCMHPFMERESLMILAPYVTLETGTGCVHTAPGHGREDYISGMKYGLPVLSPVDDVGVFTDEAGPYAGMPIYEANKVINDDMSKTGALVHQSALKHSYPHCWRCKKPVIFRATEQWFIAMDNQDLRQNALKAIKAVKWTPKWGLERIYGMVETRPDWCLSRQRTWGVPLTVFSCEKCGEVLNDEKVSARIVALFEKEGADAWFRHDNQEFLGDDTRCSCGSDQFRKEEDILDVWFDSGVSYAAVLEARPELSSPADLYLEGSDQHRGWFQSSLLASVGTRGIPPYKGVLTHGFVVDGKGKKMSKSIGNVIAPEEIINKYGAEILRLWVASEDYRDDIKISEEILRQLSDAYRKIRNTIRYMLSNLYDFNPQTDHVKLADMGELDRWALHQFELLKKKMIRGYDEFEFHGVFHNMYHFCTVTMSSLYLDILKDRLYTSAPTSPERKAAQTVLYEILEGMLSLISPVMMFTAAEAWQHLPEDADRADEISLGLFPPMKDENVAKELAEKWDRILAVRSEITKALEIARQDKVFGHSLEAQVQVHVEGELAEFLKDKWQTLKTVSIVSSLHHLDTSVEDSYRSEEIPGLAIKVSAAKGEKCERCWVRSETVGQDAEHVQLCGSCISVVRTL